MTDAETGRLEWILERHADTVALENHSAEPVAARRDQVLVAPEEVPGADESLLRWSHRREDGTGVARYYLRPDAGVNLAELVSDLRNRKNAPHRTVSPNHMVQAQNGWQFEPDSLPSPTPSVPAPDASPVQRRVSAAVLDTGLFPHPWFQDLDWYQAQQGNDILEKLDANGDRELDHYAGHGTFIAGLILQQAPAARLLIRRVLGSDGTCDEFTLVQDLRQLADHPDQQDQWWQPLDLINLSLGCHTFDDQPTPVMQDAIDSLAADSVVIASAGNNDSDRPFWPAALDTVIGVAALDDTGQHKAKFSNYGSWVDACTTGVNLRSSFVVFNGLRPAVDGVDPDRFNGYATWSGTSFAASALTGTIAAYSATEGVPVRAAAQAVLDPADGQILTDLGAVIAT